MKLYLEVNIGTLEAPDWRRIPDVPHAMIRPAMEETPDPAHTKRPVFEKTPHPMSINGTPDPEPDYGF